MPTAPPPFHLIRSHHAPISAVHLNNDNTLLYSGDQDGFVAITDLKTRRVVCYWQAHQDGILGLEEWGGGLISQGRDNLIHIHARYTKSLKSGLRSAAKDSRVDQPVLEHSIDTNSLNFCRFSLARIPPSFGIRRPQEDASASKSKAREQEALLVVPSLMDSELADIYHIPSYRRIHSSINYIPKIGSAISPAVSPPELYEMASSSRTGLIMSLHLAFTTSPQSMPAPRLVMGFEDGRLEVWTSNSDPSRASQPPTGREWLGPWDGRREGDDMSRRWSLIWSGKIHNEAVMAMTVDCNLSRAYTVSADHLLCRYDLDRIAASDTAEDIISSHSVKQIGNASLALNAKGSVIAVGGWDGKIRLFSTATFKPLGILEYHRETVHCLSFAKPSSTDTDAEMPDGSGVSLADTEEIGVDSDDEGDAPSTRERWFVSGGKDTRVALWDLMDFGG